MPLPIADSEGLNIAPSAYNEHGLAVILAHGSRYGGDWSIVAVASGQPAGEITTSVDDRRKRELEGDPAYPDRAIETAFIWLMGEAQRQGLRVVAFENLNSQYGPAERPFFCLARVVVADATFTPAPGVTYADEMTLDAVMAGAAAP